MNVNQSATKTMEERIAGLDKFPGSLPEYNTLKRGVIHHIMDTGRTTQYVMYNDPPDAALLESLVERGMCGFDLL